MNVTLEQLDLAPAELAQCRKSVEEMAYFKWLDASAPEGRSLDFWLESEREWVERRYVPRRAWPAGENDATLSDNPPPAAAMAADAPSTCVAV